MSCLLALRRFGVSVMIASLGAGCGARPDAPSTPVVVQEPEPVSVQVASAHGTPLRLEAWPTASGPVPARALVDGRIPTPSERQASDGEPGVFATAQSPVDLVFALPEMGGEVAAVVVWPAASGSVTVHTHMAGGPVTSRSWASFRHTATLHGSAEVSDTGEPWLLVLSDPAPARYVWLAFQPEPDVQTTFREVSVLDAAQLAAVRTAPTQERALRRPAEVSP